MENLNPTSPTLFYIEIEDVKAELKDNNPKEEKIEYLKWLLHSSGIEEGIIYYAECPDEQIPGEWRGLLHARSGKKSISFSDNEEQREYEAGARQWEIYCKVKESLAELTGS